MFIPDPDFYPPMIRDRKKISWIRIRKFAEKISNVLTVRECLHFYRLFLFHKKLSYNGVRRHSSRLSVRHDDGDGSWLLETADHIIFLKITHTYKIQERQHKILTENRGGKGENISFLLERGILASPKVICYLFKKFPDSNKKTVFSQFSVV
jgi:hypothetical protein